MEVIKMWANLMSMLCNALANGLASVANIATNSISLYGQYEHEMPKCLKK
jgi:cyclic lactone autoinducer peptide